MLISQRPTLSEEVVNDNRSLEAIDIDVDQLHNTYVSLSRA